MPRLLDTQPMPQVCTMVTSPGDWRLCVAPMIDVTDRHCRYFHRLLAPKARLYTEMITTGALLHGDVAYHLNFNPSEQPVALQLGGSDPVALAHCAKLGESWGYAEINLNCGCPSDRVQRGAFGACLMAEPQRVAQAVKAMQDAVSIPVTVKHRLGLDHNEDYSFVRDFVGALYEVGVRVFIVHARNAVLGGLSPKDNREIPPLRYSTAAQLADDFGDAAFVLNGGIKTSAQAQQWGAHFKGVMLGRAAWHTPAILREIHGQWWPKSPLMSDERILEIMMRYASAQVRQGVPLRFVTRPMLGWPSGRPGARRWRQRLSDAQALARQDVSLLGEAWEELVAA